MNAAIVTGPGQIPRYGEFAEPVPHAGEELVTVAASALTNLTKARASGGHYSGGTDYPFVPGVDGVGRLANGARVYFFMPRSPFGGLAERTVVRAAGCLPVPDALDDVTAAAIANPGMSAMAALVERAQFQAGETVLVNGATGSAGRMAVQIARHLGAAKVIATGRNTKAMAQATTLGAEVTIPLEQAPESLSAQLEEQFAAGVDVILDYLWGPSAEAILTAGAKASPVAKRIRFVQIGAPASETIEVPASMLRSSAIEILGSGLGSMPPDRLLGAIQAVLDAAPEAGFTLAVRTVPLSDIEQTWNDSTSRERIVFTM
jgi:NADPH:quinone reductase-like Zn-dependent oxidoreductase